MSYKFTLTPDGPALKMNGHARPRRELMDAFAEADKAKKKTIRGKYDAAQDLQDTKNHWASADTFDADSANSLAVRSKLVPRSRYEIGNNGYSDGIAQTYATDLVGIGPQLRMQTGSEGFNRLVELNWFLWCKAVQFRRKLWCLAHAKHGDGEGLGVIRLNPNVANPVKLDWVLYETEQCQTPMLGVEPGQIDGIKFDQFGNPTSYDILPAHPGGAFGFMNKMLEPEAVPAQFVTHWFKLRRPGQHRGIPETSSTLNLGAAARRWRESTLSHAELIAKLTVLLKTLMQPADEDADPVTALSTLELMAGTMLALPNTVEPVQLDSKQPAATYEMFHKQLVNEQARPKSMPYNKAACDSSSYNYASGRLDHQTYYAALDVEREDCNDLVLDRLFDRWFEMAVVTFGWLGGVPDAISAGARAHQWDWPKHRVVDIQAEASSNDVKLKNGSVSLPLLYSDGGMDYEDELIKAATSNGITVDQQRQINLLINVAPRALPFIAQVLGLQQPAATPQQAADNTAQDAAADNTVKASWITLKNGVHVEIDEDTGEITKGPNSMRGKTVAEVEKESESGTWPEPAKNSGSRSKVSIDEAAMKLERMGWKLGPPQPFKPGDKETVYEVTHIKTGKKVFKTAKQIREVIS